MSFVEGEITVEFGGTVGPAGPAGNAVPIAAGTVLANPTGVLANPVGVDAAGMRTLLGVNAKNIILFGADPTGVADSTSAILAADAAAEASGGDVYFPSGTYRVDGLLRLASSASGAAIRTMRPRRWIGDGSWKDTTASTELPTQGTILDCRNNTAASLLLKPRGSFEMRGIAISNLGTAHTQPILKITNTVAHIIDCSFIGHSSKNGLTCDQPAIVFGGTTSDAIGNDDDSPFQGYGTTIERCYFERIRHVAKWQMFANDIKFLNNVVWAGCGGDCVFTCDPVLSGQFAAGATIADNTIEMLHYTVLAKLDHAVSWWFRGNGLYDATELGIDPDGLIHLVDCPAIRFDDGLMPAYTKLVKDGGNSTWTHISTTQGTETYFGPLFPLRADQLRTRGMLADKGDDPILIQPHAAHTEANTNFVMPRSLSKDGSITYFNMLRSGIIYLGGTVSTILDAIGWTLGNDGFRRKGAGGPIFFDSGSGGSVNTYQGFRHLYVDHTGAEMLRLQSGLVQITGLPTSNPGGTGRLWNDGGTIKIT